MGKQWGVHYTNLAIAVRLKICIFRSAYQRRLGESTCFNTWADGHSYNRIQGRHWRRLQNLSAGTWRLSQGVYEKPKKWETLRHEERKPRYACAKNHVLKFIRKRSKEPKRQNTYLETCAPSEDSDQPAHSRSLIRIFTERILDRHRCSVSSCGQRRLRSDCADAQADLSLRWTHLPEGMFSHVAVQ